MLCMSIDFKTRIVAMKHVTNNGIMQRDNEVINIMKNELSNVSSKVYL